LDRINTKNHSDSSGDNICFFLAKATCLGLGEFDQTAEGRGRGRPRLEQHATGKHASSTIGTMLSIEYRCLLKITKATDYASIGGM
jgi:hypothetical protein